MRTGVRHRRDRRLPTCRIDERDNRAGVLDDVHQLVRRPMPVDRDADPPPVGDATLWDEPLTGISRVAQESYKALNAIGLKAARWGALRTER